MPFCLEVCQQERRGGGGGAISVYLLVPFVVPQVCTFVVWCDSVVVAQAVPGNPLGFLTGLMINQLGGVGD